MSGPVITDTTCGAFRRLRPESLQDGRIHRMVVGEDTRVRVLEADEAARELGDPFATLLLLRGIFPRTAGEVIERLQEEEAPDAGEPLFFLLGEGSQIPMSIATAGVQRRLRFLVAHGLGAEGADVLISAFHPDEGNVELMAWDRRSGGFNYYQTVGATSAWVFAGNSRHALTDPTQGKGPFESHLSGNVVMKELRFPWLHWHSKKANILPSVLPEDPPLVGHPWVTGLAPQGAQTCEVDVAIPGIRRWTRTRFDQLLADGGVVDDPRRLLLQVLETPSVNIITSNRESRAAVKPGPPVDLPQTFFVDSVGLTEILGLAQPPPLAVSNQVYARSLATFRFRLEDRRGFVQPGDTFFAFAVPERAFEDQAVLERALAVGLLTRRLAACLLMTDFPNPIFSARRAALMSHVPAQAVVRNGRSDFSEQMGEAITAAAPGTPEGSPQREFADRWARGEDFDSFDDELRAYYAAVTARLATQEGFDAYTRLAESRRRLVHPMPIFESDLLFATTSGIDRGPRSMRADGTVEEA